MYLKLNYKVLNKMIKIIQAESIHSKMILDWKNDIDSRKNSLDSKIILFESHDKWYNNYLKKNPFQLLIGTLGDDFIGMVRFDNIYDKTSYNVSINLNPLFRGKKLSATFLKKAIDFFTSRIDCKSMYADIKPTNIASIKCFEKNNFVIFQNTIHSGSEHYKYLLDFKN